MRDDIKNFYYLLIQNKEFNTIIFDEELLIINGKTLDLSNFNLNEFLLNNEAFKNDLGKLNPDAIYDILNLHINKRKDNKKSIDDKKLEELALKYEVFKSFHLINNVDIINNVTKKYLHYIDNNGKSYILKDVDGEALVKRYYELISKKNSNIDAKELFESLTADYKLLKFESLTEALGRPFASSEHINNLKELNNQNIQTGETLDIPIGNEEEGIYLSHNKIYTFNLNKNKEMVKESHELRDNKTENVNGERINKEKTIDEDNIKIISFEKYQDLILNRQVLNSEEFEQILVYETYLSELVTYEAYLTNDLKEVYDKFIRLNRYLGAIDNLSPVMIDAIKRYEEIFRRSENKILTNELEKEQTLARINNKYQTSGFISIAIIISAMTIALGFILASLLK